MDPMIKGYIIQQTGKYMLEDADVSARLPRSVVEQIRRNAVSLKPTGWCSRSEVVTLWRALADTQPDERSAHEKLVLCGEAICTYALGTFLKLLLKVLTPRMFANKYPDLYQRDHQGGHIEVGGVDEKSVVFLVKDVGGFDHFGPVAAGWGALTLKGMGLKDAQMVESPWSLQNPGPASLRFDATWR